MDWAWIADKLLDVGIGLLSTFLGILLVYLLAKPRIEFDEIINRTRAYSALKSPRRSVLFRSKTPKNVRYGVRLRNKGRIRIQTMSVEAWLNIPNSIRHTSIPVPLSRTVWTNFAQTKGLWRASPKFLLRHIDWSRNLPEHLSPPRRDASLEEIMRLYNATLFVRATATSTLFAVTVIRSRKYRVPDIRSI